MAKIELDPEKVAKFTDDYSILHFSLDQYKAMWEFAEELCLFFDFDRFTAMTLMKSSIAHVQQKMKVFHVDVFSFIPQQRIVYQRNLLETGKEKVYHLMKQDTDKVRVDELFQRLLDKHFYSILGEMSVSEEK